MSVRVEQRGPITIVTLDRPEARNAIDRPTADALAAAMRAFADDAGQRVAVLTGAGGVFCAGADLKAIGSERGNRVEPEGDGPLGPTRMMLPKPCIAAIEGHAVAGGLELALWCDLRVASREATLGVFCRRFGVPLIDGGTVRLPRLIGLSHALDLILTGRAVGAEEAHRMGLVNRLSEPGQALAEALVLAGELAMLPQTCMNNDRRAAYEQFGMGLDEALGHELRLGQASLAAEEFAGSLGRFVAGEGRHGSKVVGGAK